MNYSHKDTDPFLSEIDTNLFAGASANGKVVSSLQTEKSTSSWVDLLSGEDMFSESISQQVPENVVHEEGDLLAFLDDSVHNDQKGGNDSQKVPQQDGRPSDHGAQRYISCFKVLVSLHGF